MDEQLMIICISRHLSGIHYKMTLWTRTTFVLLKVRDLEFSWYLYTRNQAEFLGVLSKQIFPTNSFDFQLNLVELFLEIFHKVTLICAITLIMINLIAIIRNSVNHRGRNCHSGLRKCHSDLGKSYP